MILEDQLTETIVQQLAAVGKAEDWSFNNLVLLSGLDPSRDFRHLDLRGLDLRGADLRGFDFSFSDLRECLKNADTLIDQTTIFEGAAIEWIDIQNSTIVQKMAAVENANGHSQRRKHLSELKSDYHSPDHIRIYLRNLILATQSVEAFFDYLDFFEPKTPEDVIAISKGLRKFSMNSVKRSGRNKRYLSPSTTSYRILLDRIAESSNSVVGDAFNFYLAELERKGRTDRIPTRNTADDDFQSLLVAIDGVAGQMNLGL